MIVCVLRYEARKARALYYIFTCGLSPSAVSFTVFQVFEIIEKRIERISGFKEMLEIFLILRSTDEAL